MKRRLYVVLAVLLVVPLVFTLMGYTEVSAYTDVPKDHWANTYIEDLTEKGLVKGYENGKQNEFRPDVYITRAEFIAMAQIKGEKRNKDFADVPKDYWAYSSIMNSGCQGYPNNLFKPDDPITREEAIVMLYISNGNPKYTGKVSAKALKGVSKWAEDAISWMYSTNLLTGYENGEYRPQANITRAEAATLISKVIKHKEETNKDPNKEVSTSDGAITTGGSIEEKPSGGGSSGGGGSGGGGSGGGGSGGGGGDKPIAKLLVDIFTFFKGTEGRIEEVPFDEGQVFVPGDKMEKQFRLVNSGNVRAEYAAYMCGDIVTNDLMKKNIEVWVLDEEENYVMQPTLLSGIEVSRIDASKDLDGILLFKNVFNVGETHKYKLVVKVIDKDEEQGIGGKETDFRVYFVLND